MPVTRREPGYDNGEHGDPSNITGFLFDDLEGSAGLSALNTGAEEGFPQLYAQKGNPNVVSYVLLPVAPLNSALHKLVPCHLGRSWIRTASVKTCPGLNPFSIQCRHIGPDL